MGLRLETALSCGKAGRESWRQGVPLWLLPCLDEATGGFLFFSNRQQNELCGLHCLNTVDGGELLVRSLWNG